ncbi:hypothetical protein [Halodurantibacterium flavum]
MMPPTVTGVRPVGRQAAARKYDLITALGVHGCHGDKHRQRLALRLITLIVARYNWQGDEIAVGQREMAALWGVDERTVKREVARLRAMGWLVQKRAAQRGRVAVHGLDLAAILAGTRDDWAAVGPDYVTRMSEPAGDTAAGQGANVVRFEPRHTDVGAGAGAEDTGEGETADGPVGVWDRALRQLSGEDPALARTWFRALVPEGPAEGGHLVLQAPSRFHASFVTTHHLTRLLTAVQREDGTIRRLSVCP